MEKIAPSEYNNLYDRDFTSRMYNQVLEPIATEYFRGRLVNAHKLPMHEIGNRPVIFFGNHSGTGLSWDNIIFDYLFFEELKKLFDGNENLALTHKLRRLIYPQLIGVSKTAPFGIKEWWHKTGCISISMENFDWAVSTKDFVYISPEGVPGIAKGFSQRYKLRQYSSSFVYMAKKYNALLVPISIVNAEYAQPYNFRSERVNKFMSRFGFPFFPLGPAWLQLFAPATYLTPMPVKLTYVVHDPIDPMQLSPSMERHVLARETDEIRRAHQKELDSAVAEFHSPYDWMSLLNAFLASKRKKAMFPFLWHELFLDVEGVIPKFAQHAYKVPLGFPLAYAARVFYENKKRTENQLIS